MNVWSVVDGVLRSCNVSTERFDSEGESREVFHPQKNKGYNPVYLVMSQLRPPQSSGPLGMTLGLGEF